MWGKENETNDSKTINEKIKNCINTKNYKVVKNNAKKKLAMLCYEISKSKLPRLRTTKRKAT